MSTEQKPNESGAGLVPAPPAEKRSTVIYLDSATRRRLEEFALARYPGRQHMRNRAILEALDTFLSKEGY